ncbi:hypothetical protein BGZ46_002173 [Entomortierella lignicola]|nr:hypothetical protein BGZ46_002173 [Entomortierella lignicola]
MGRSIFSSSQNNLSARGVLGTANGLLENARKTKDNHTEVLSLCNDAKSKLKDVETILASNRLHDQGLENDIVNAYHEHAKLLDDLGYHEKAQESHNIAQELGYVYATSQQSASSQTASISTSISRSIIPSTAFAVAPAITIKAAQTILDFSATKPNNQNSSQQPPLADINTLTHQTDEDREDARKNIFDRNVRLPVIKQALPVAGARITSTPQLVYCLGLLQPSLVPADQLNEIEIEWLHVMDTNLDERERLQAMATDLIRAFLQDELKKPDTVAEVVSLTPVLDRVDFEKLLKVFVDSIESSILLDMHLLDGLARLLKDARPGYIDSDNLVKILKHLSARLIGNHNRSVGHSHQLSVTVSHVLDSMVDSQVEVLEHEQVHELLLGYLKSLQSTSDPSLLYQSAYAHQALQYILDDKTIIRSMLRRTGKLFQGISGMRDSTPS